MQMENFGCDMAQYLEKKRKNWKWSPLLNFGGNKIAAHDGKVGRDKVE